MSRDHQFILARKDVMLTMAKGQTKYPDAVSAAVKRYPEVGYRELFLACKKTTAQPQ